MQAKRPKPEEHANRFLDGAWFVRRHRVEGPRENQNLNFENQRTKKSGKEVGRCCGQRTRGLSNSPGSMPTLNFREHSMSSAS